MTTFGSGMRERRRPERRGFAGGVIVGTLGGLAAGVVSALADGAGGAPVLLPLLAGLHAGAGALLGGTLGLAKAFAEPAVQAIAQRRTRRVRAAALLYSLGLAPALALLGTRLVPALASPLSAAGVAAGALLLLFVALWASLSLAEAIDLRVRRGEGQVGPAFAAAAVGTAVAVGARLAIAAAPASPPPLRVALWLVALGAWMGVVYWVVRGLRAADRRWARLATPRAAIAVGLVAVTLAALALSELREDRRAARALATSGDVVVEQLVGGTPR